ncbi:MAG: PD-(D/E)XK nuclease family protein, partial [Clostridia bacterium]|nr:PD-(D/E)XK nuclease family protein [Clostridia bacterium]
TLAVETDKNSAPDGWLFAPVNYSVARLEALATEAGEPIERESIETAHQGPWDIALMERRLFALGGRGEAQQPENIRLLAASTMRALAHRTGAMIREMAQAGEKSSAMAVVYPKGSGYAPLLAEILPMYGVSPYIAERRAASGHPLCRFVLYSLRAVSGGFVTNDVVECIRSGFLPLSQNQADALIAYAEGTDVRMEGWKRTFTYAKDGDKEALEAINESRAAVMKPLLAVQAALRRAKTADDTISAVLALLEDVEAFERLSDMRMELMEAGMEPEAQDCAQVWNALMETLEQLHTLMGGHAMSAQDVLSMLSGGLSALELSALPPADGAIICGEIGNVRTAQVDTLFAIGMNDEGGAQDSALLTPGEREEAVRATGAYLGMTAGEREALSQLDTLKALSGAKKQLIVCYALADETGRALREGSAVQALRRLFPEMRATGGMPEEELAHMLCTPEAALEALSVHLSRVTDGKEALDEVYAKAYAALDADDTLRRQLAQVTRKLSEAPQRRLESSRARALYGRPVMSVSRLEMFAQCPYQHFVRYGLAPRQEMEPGVDRAELGTLYHEAAGAFTREVMKLPEFPNVDKAQCDRVMDEAVAPLIENWRTSPLGESARGGAIAGRIRRTARRAGRSILSQFEESRFAPMRFELAFGQNGIAPVILELDDGSHVYLQGRIDRIDVLEEEGKHIRIIDYKSGSKKFDPTMVYWGIQLQLLIYLAAALRQTPGAQPAGFFYCRIADPMIKTEQRIKEEVERQIAKKLALAGISLSDVAILSAQDAHHQQMITKDGKPSGRYSASMVDGQGMQALVDFAKGKASSLAQAAFGGEIDDAPATLGTYNACTFCDYAAVCGFDPARKQRRRLGKKKLEDLTGTGI